MITSYTYSYLYISLCLGVTNSSSIDKISDFKIRRDHQKFSYERHDYESVDERVYLRLCPEKQRKKNSGSEGLYIEAQNSHINICHLLPSVTNW